MGLDVDIVIVGGGLNGSVQAIAFASVGFRVALVDPQEETDLRDREFDGRAYALSSASQQMLNALGVWPLVSGKSEPINQIKVSDGQAGKGASALHVHFDCQELDNGPMGHMLEDRFLRCAVMGMLLDTPNIDVRYGVSATGQTIEPGVVLVDLSDGTQITGLVLVGSDGRRSHVAERAGIKITGWDYEQSSLVCSIQHERSHGNIAHQFFTPAGPLAILPLSDNRSSIVWTEGRDQADKINGMDDVGYLAALRPVFGVFLGDIKLAGARFMYPLGLSLAQEMVRPRLALIGDASHGIHPLAGQGLNLGLGDIASLTEVLIDAARRGEDIGSINTLTRYQNWRRFDVAAMSAATDVINRVFSNDNSILRAVRDAGLGIVNSTPALRKGMMRHAAGLSGSKPKLLTGKAL